jgi:L-2-aminoadipate reductase
MPLNPNGKVDKPALPFPDTAQLAAASRQSRKDKAGETTNLSPTEHIVRDLWLSIIPHSPRDLEITDNFFDVGGHSILATRVVFEIRKRFAIDLPLGILFRQPTVGGLSHEIDLLRGESLDMALRPPTRHGADVTVDYLADTIQLSKGLAHSYQSAGKLSKGDSITVFLTGATGFLGAFLVRDLLSRAESKIRIVAHVRAKSDEEGLRRLVNTCEAYGVWNEEWLSRAEVVPGSLEQERLGLTPEKWDELTNTIDIVLHNGAMVRPAFPASSMLTNRLGSMGVPICTVTRRERHGDVVRISSLSNRETEEIRIYFFYIGSRHGTLREIVR